MKYFVENKVTIFRLFFFKYKKVYYIFFSTELILYSETKVQPLISLAILIFYSRYILIFFLVMFNK